MNVSCAQCSAKIALERDDSFLRCPFCQSTLYLDRARTFRSFRLPPAVPKGRVPDLLYQQLDLLELPRLPLRSCAGLLLPFWGVLGPQGQETIPAFSPLPPGLAGFRLPASGSIPETERGLPGFESVPCSESSSAAWEGRSDVTSFGLYSVPFYRVDFGGSEGSYAAWVDAVEGSVRLDDSPPPLTERISRRFWVVTGGMFLGLTAEAILIPRGLAAAAAVILTAAAAYPTLAGLFREDAR